MGNEAKHVELPKPNILLAPVGVLSVSEALWSAKNRDEGTYYAASHFFVVEFNWIHDLCTHPVRDDPMARVTQAGNRLTSPRPKEGANSPGPLLWTAIRRQLVLGKNTIRKQEPKTTEGSSPPRCPSSSCNIHPPVKHEDSTISSSRSMSPARRGLWLSRFTDPAHLIHPSHDNGISIAMFLDGTVISNAGFN